MSGLRGGWKGGYRAISADGCNFKKIAHRSIPVGAMGRVMHFFYLDETGCNGADLNTSQEPVFVLGGISVKDQGWVATTQEMERVVGSYFGPAGIPPNFELHAHQLLSPNGEGPFAGHDREVRSQFALDLLDIIIDRSHQIHYIAIDKNKLATDAVGDEHDKFSTRTPYLLAFDYIITLIESYVKEKLGHTARGITIIDEKPLFDDDVSNITRYRRFEVAKSHRIKWLVEFTYSIDSKKHPMIQLGDLVIYCVKKFLELESGYRDSWPDEAKKFYAKCFDKIHGRVAFKSIVEQGGRHAVKVNKLLQHVQAKPRSRWRSRYGI